MKLTIPLRHLYVSVALKSNWLCVQSLSSEFQPTCWLWQIQSSIYNLFLWTLRRSWVDKGTSMNNENNGNSLNMKIKDYSNITNAFFFSLILRDSSNVVNSPRFWIGNGTPTPTRASVKFIVGAFAWLVFAIMVFLISFFFIVVYGILDLV